MARPRKKGNVYFPFDVDFFGDRKIKEVRGKYGTDGVTLYIYLLCAIYEEGYYLQVDSGLNYVASYDLGMSDEKIGQMLNFLCERSLFDNKLFASDKVLTSRGIQLRFQEMVRTRAVKTGIEVNKSFWLLEEDETESFIKCTLFEGFSKKNGSYSEKNPCYSEKNDTKEKGKGKGKEKEKGNINNDYQRIVELYHSICKDYPVLIKINDSRKRALSARLKKYTVSDFETLFKKAQASSFLKGNNSSGWRATFDWLINESNMTKVLEGNYDDKPTKTAAVTDDFADLEMLTRRRIAMRGESDDDEE